MGCVKPRMHRFGAGPLLLSGGRMCVANGTCSGSLCVFFTTPSKTLPCTVTDMFVWLNGDGLAGGAASKLPAAETWRKVHGGGRF